MGRRESNSKSQNKIKNSASRLGTEIVGGAKGDRTPDLVTASHALSQLSYGPTRFV